MAIYEPADYRLSRRRGLQHADAEDLCQQVFLSVAKAVETWEAQKEGPRFRNWLVRVTRNANIICLGRLSDPKQPCQNCIRRLDCRTIHVLEALIIGIVRQIPFLAATR